MKVAFASLLGVCLLSVASAGDYWDEYLDDGNPPVTVKLDEEERVPLMLLEPSMNDCLGVSLKETVRQFELDLERTDAPTPRETLRSKTVSFCKQKLEEEAKENLAKLDNATKERVNSLVESMIKANGGQGFSAEFHMPYKSIQ